MKKVCRLVRALLVVSMVVVLVDLVYETVHLFFGRGSTVTILVTYFVGGVVLVISSLMQAIVKIGQAAIDQRPESPYISQPSALLPKGLGWLLPQWFVSEFALDIVADLRDRASDYPGNAWWLIVALELAKMIIKFAGRRFHHCKYAATDSGLSNELCSVDSEPGQPVLESTIERPLPRSANQGPGSSEEDFMDAIRQVIGTYIERGHEDLSEFGNGLHELLSGLEFADQLDPVLAELLPNQADVSAQEYILWVSALSILREHLANRRQAAQRQAGQQSSEDNQEEGEADDGGGDDDGGDDDGGDDDGNPAKALSGKRFLRTLWELGYMPDVVAVIKMTFGYPVIRNIVGASIWVKDILKPKFETGRDNVLGFMQTVMNFPLVIALSGKAFRDRYPDNLVVQIGVTLVATALFPIIWLAGILFLIFRIIMRPGKVLELVGLDGIIEME